MKSLSIKRATIAKLTAPAEEISFVYRASSRFLALRSSNRNPSDISQSTGANGVKKSMPGVSSFLLEWRCLSREEEMEPFLVKIRGSQGE